jgi:hypothetical protein
MDTHQHISQKRIPMSIEQDQFDVYLDVYNAATEYEMEPSEENHALYELAVAALNTYEAQLREGSEDTE